MNIVIRIDVEEAHQPVNVLVQSASELVHLTTKSTSPEAKLLVQDTSTNPVPSTSTSLVPSTSNTSTTNTLTPRWRNENNGKCTSTNCLRPLYTKTLCQACYKKLNRAEYTPSEDALRCAASWVEVVKSKPSKQQQRAWAKTFDDMARIDKLSWADIAAINSYAFENWVPQGYIQSPTKYRKRSRTYPEQWTWEVIRGHMQNGSNQRSAESTYDPLQGIDLS